MFRVLSVWINNNDPTIQSCPALQFFLFEKQIHSDMHQIRKSFAFPAQFIKNDRLNVQ